MTTTVLLICGGDGSEHDISLISADYVEQKLKAIPGTEVIRTCIHDHRFLLNDGSIATFVEDSQLLIHGRRVHIDAAVPCLHGIPGETGDIQSFLEILDIPYIGCGSEASRNCFNKVTTKFYMDKLGIANTEYRYLPRNCDRYQKVAMAAFETWHDVYIKAACQGSSIGCYHVTDKSQVADAVNQAFSYSPEVLIERTIPHRELEVAAYEYDGRLVITNPGEIIMPDNAFYTFDEKYSTDSSTVTTVEPKGLTDFQVNRIRDMAKNVFISLKLRDLSRIDFFLAASGEILINEINTFPGMTPISMFPKLLEHNGHNMVQFLHLAIDRAIARKRYR